MAANPRIVTAETWIEWDGVSQRLPKGQQIDVAPDSPLERAIGRQNLVLPGGAPVQPPEPAPQEEPKPAPAKPRAAAKASDGKDGGQ